MSVHKVTTRNINHGQIAFEDFINTYLDRDFSDVTLIVEGAEFPAHKFVLAARSDYFRALLFGGLKEATQKEIALKDAKKESFEILLRYIYTGRMELQVIKVDLLLDVLELSQTWGFENIVNELVTLVQKSLTVDILWNVYKMADQYGLRLLSNECKTFACCHAAQVLEHDSFNQLPLNLVNELLSIDFFFAPEALIFQRLCNWISQLRDFEPDVVQVFKQVRWPLIALPDFCRICGMLKPEHQKTVMGMVVNRPQVLNSKPRNYALPEVNVALKEHGAKVVKPERAQQWAVNGKNINSLVSGYTSSALSPSESEGIVIDLGREYLLNCFRLKLYGARFSYYIQVSVDQDSWVKVIDYRQFICYDWQEMYFDSQNARYIKVVGTRCALRTQPCDLKVQAFKAYFCPSIPKTFNTKIGFFDGVNGDLIQVLKPDLPFINRNMANCKHAVSHDWHWTIADPLAFMFKQPHVISSMKVLVYDPRSSGHGFTVETSKDESDWKVVSILQFSNTPQILAFEPNPVSYIRLVRPQKSQPTPLCVKLECYSKFS